MLPQVPLPSKEAWMSLNRPQPPYAPCPLPGTCGGRISYSSVDAFGPCPACVSTSFSNTASGWVAGAGVDWAPWSNNWIVRVEYLHYDLQGAASSSFLPGVPVPLANPAWNNISVDSVRAGLSYKF